MAIYYTFNENGELVPHEYDEGDFMTGKRSNLPNGRYQIIEGKNVRVGESHARPDEPWCNKAIDWNKGVVNPTDGKRYGSKQKYLDAVKRSGGKVVGADASAKQRTEIRGDFDVRKDLTEVTRKVLSKHGA